MIDDIITLALLILLQAVLGFDNLLYISLESKKALANKQKMVRTWGIGLAIVLRIVLLFVLVNLVEKFQNPFLIIDHPWLHTYMNFHSLIVLIGGIFIIYTAIKEIWHMMSIHPEETLSEGNKKASTTKIIGMIVVMNLVFSFDSILSAMALTSVIWIMTTAIIISGLLMIWLSDHVSVFLQKNRMYEVLGLFVLFVVGIMLVSEGGHLAHLEFFGYHITPMSKATFYFILFILVLIDIVQGRYQKKISVELESEGH